MRHRAVLFDLFDTLIGGWPAGATARMAEVLGAPADAVERRWEELRPARTLGERLDVQLRRIADELGVDAPDDAIAAALDARLGAARTAVRPEPGGVETLRELKARGLRVGLVSNCASEGPALWPDFEYAQLVDDAVFSCDVGVKKPDPAIFRLACERLGVEPREALFVDDQEPNVTAARATGLGAVRYGPDGDITSLREVLGLVR